MRRFRTEIAVCIALSALTLGAMGAALLERLRQLRRQAITSPTMLRSRPASAAPGSRGPSPRRRGQLASADLAVAATRCRRCSAADSACGFHLTNLLLHTANVLLLFLALRRLTGAVWRSASVAALFAVHPAHVESVAWVAERKDVLSGLFWMLTLLGLRLVRRASGLATLSAGAGDLRAGADGQADAGHAAVRAAAAGLLAAGTVTDGEDALA